jgi:hypothetical protein
MIRSPFAFKKIGFAYFLHCTCIYRMFFAFLLDPQR